MAMMKVRILFFIIWQCNNEELFFNDVGVAGDDDENVDGNDDEKEEKVDGNDDEMKDGVGKDGVGNEKVNGNSGDGNDEGKDDSCLVVTIFNYLEM
jgi:hypothetical protein